MTGSRWSATTAGPTSRSALAMDHPGAVSAPRGAGRGADRRGAGALRRALRRAPGGTGSSSRSRTSRSGRSSPTRTPGTATPGADGARRRTRTTARPIHDPATVHAMLEDYRAGLGIDRAHDEADRRRRAADRLPDAARCGRLRDDLEDLYGDPLAIWRAWAPDLRGHGHGLRPSHGRGGAPGLGGRTTRVPSRARQAKLRESTGRRDDPAG